MLIIQPEEDEYRVNVVSVHEAAMKITHITDEILRMVLSKATRDKHCNRLSPDLGDEHAFVQLLLLDVLRDKHQHTCEEVEPLFSTKPGSP